MWYFLLAVVVTIIINEVEKQIAEKVGRKYAVALSAGTAALHFAIKLCGEKLYGQAPVGH